MNNGYLWMLAGLMFWAGCGSTGQLGSPAVPAIRVEQSQAPTDPPHFAVIEGELVESQVATHQLRLDPSLFDLPRGQAILRVALEHERGRSVQFHFLDSSKSLTGAAGEVLVRATTGDVLELQVVGQGDYRLLVSLLGDSDGDGDVDGFDRAVESQENLGVSTRVRPLELHFALAPGWEPLASLQESTDGTAVFSGHVTPGSRLSIQPREVVSFKAESVPVDKQGNFQFQAPLSAGDNLFQAVATDAFGQQAEASALVSQVAASSEPPEAISPDKLNRIWLLDVHLNNYLFRGPLPLTNLEETGRVDFPSLIRVMNQRLLQEGAPISALPAEFDFTEIVLITNRATTSASHGDEGFSLHQIYRTLLGFDPPWPPADDRDPTSLFTKPLDNTVTPGSELQQTVDGQTYTIHPQVLWQPVSANPTGQAPTTVREGASGYETVVRSTFPIVSIAPNPNQPQRQLTHPLSNLSVVTRNLHQLMEQDHRQTRPHIYYFHCINGHDRTGMVSTAYVLSAYGASYGYDLATAYKYGQMAAYLPGLLPPDVDADRNFWDKLEADAKNTGKLKKKYMEAVQALAFLYDHSEGTRIQKEPKLTPKVPDRPLWEAGFTFTDSAAVPTLDTPADYLHVRASP